VHDPFVVRGREGQRNLTAVVDGFLNREVLGVQLVAQRYAFEELGHEIRRALVHSDVVDSQHPRVIQCGCRPRLLFEATQTFVIGGKYRRNDLDRHAPPETAVACVIHLAHPAGAEQSVDLVGSELRSWLKTH
jgi:hypothetical protein